MSEKTDVIRYSCTQLSLSAGIYPRIQINTKEKKVALEYSGFDLSDIFHFQDSLIESVDTLETIAVEEELFINENQKTLEWINISSLKPLSKDNIEDCLISDINEDEILLIEPFDISGTKGVIVIAKRLSKNYDEDKICHLCVPFLYDEESCEYIEECSTVFWNGLEGIFISEIVHNNFPLILALESKYKYGEGKGLKMIYNRIINE